MKPLRILIADDHPLYRDGLKSLLNKHTNMTLVGEAATGTEVVELATGLQPDVVVMDLRMPEINGIDATRRILGASPHVAVIVLTMFNDDDSVFAAMRAGARGYLLKDAAQAEILRAIESVADGGAIFGPAIAQRVITFFTTPRSPHLPHSFPELTNREREVLDLIARGESNSLIAQRLVLSPKTVRNHVSNIFAKLQIADRAQAIVRARQAGLGQEQ